MQNPTQPSIQLSNTQDYRENYANSVQVRVNVWDFFLVFGTLQQQDETRVEVRNFQGIYLSPQQAKALHTILQQNLVNYENTFGEIKLDPRMQPGGGGGNQASAKAMADQMKLDFGWLGQDCFKQRIHTLTSHQACPLFHLVVGGEVQQVECARFNPAEELSDSSRASSDHSCAAAFEHRCPAMHCR